ncbi:MAG: triple tyrosine motif-containing protein [Lysobacteraceae bacterium]
MSTPSGNRYLVRMTTAMLLWMAGTTAATGHPLLEHPVIDTWSLESGLPQVSVEVLAQDARGFIWLGTQDGLARFDGLRMHWIGAGPDQALPGSWIRALRPAPDGAMWIAGHRGLARYRDGELVHVPMPFEDPDIADVLVEADGSVVFTEVTRGVFVLPGGKPDAAVEARAALDGPALPLARAGGTLWVGGRGRAWSLGARVVEHPFPGTHAGAAVRQFIEDGEQLLAATDGGLLHFTDGHWQVVLEAGLSTLPVSALAADPDGGVWVAGPDQVMLWRPGRAPEALDGPSMPQRPAALMFDTEGNLWVGQRWLGVSRLWAGWTRRYGVGDGLHEPTTFALAGDGSGGLFVATDDGVAWLRDGRYTPLVRGEELVSPGVLSLDRQGADLWLGTARGVHRWRDGRVERPQQPPELANAVVAGLHADADGSVWFGSAAGLFRATAEGIAPVPGSPARVRVLSRDPDDRLWAGSVQGLYRLHDDRLERVREPGLPDGADVTAIHHLADGRMLVATLDGGVLLRTGGTWTNLSQAGGLPRLRTHHIAETSGGQLWFSTIRGAYHIEVAQLGPLSAGEPVRVGSDLLLVSLQARRSGQRGLCCNGSGNNAGVLDDRDVLWLPTREGVLAVETRRSRVQGAPAPVITAAHQHGERLYPGPGTLALSPGRRDIGFEFTALWLRDPDLLRIQSRLSGFHEDWRDLDDLLRPQAGYTNLPPGRYRFEVRAAAGDGPWSEPTGVGFEVAPHFRETRVFGLLVATLSVAGIATVLMLQRRRHQAQRRRLETLVRARARELQASHRLLSQTSHVDHETGARNQRYLRNQMPTDLAHYERQGARLHACGLALAMVRPDGGTDAWTRLLERLASRLRRCDYIVRWNRSELLLVSRPLTREDALRFAGRVHALVAVAGVTPAAVGLALHPLAEERRGSIGWEGSVDIARHALDHATAHHGGWVLLLPPRDGDQAGLQLSLQLGVDSAIAHGRVTVHQSVQTRDSDVVV